MPSGNARVISLTDNEVRLAPDVRDTQEPWFYWHVRVRGCAGRIVRFIFEEPNTLTVRGAAVSRDGGWTWQWIPEYDPVQWAFTYNCGPDDELHFSLAMPYTLRNLDQWLAAHRGSPALQAGSLCQSRSGRDVPLLRLGRLDDQETCQALITCRHHCCEMMPSYQLEGLMEGVLADDSTGRALREHVAFSIVPLVDLEGVEAGDQGKSRAPHDHNRDYGSPSIYPETAAIRHLVNRKLDDRLRLTLDLHGPWVRHRWNEHIYIVGTQNEANAARQQAFAAVLKKANAGGALPYGPDGLLPFGQEWNTWMPGSALCSSTRWMAANVPGATCLSMEFPYADVLGTPVTAEAARDFGRAMARAIADYLLRSV
jgi:hypothetical protein